MESLLWVKEESNKRQIPLILFNYPLIENPSQTLIAEENQIESAARHLNIQVISLREDRSSGQSTGGSVPCSRKFSLKISGSGKISHH